MAISLTETVSLISDIFMFSTVPIYILIIVTLIKYRNDDILKHSFFTLIISVGIADIGAIFVIFFGNKLAGYGWIPEVYLYLGPLASRLNAIFGFFFGGAQAIGVLLIGINRFTAYLFPFTYEKLFNHGYLLRLLIALKWLISLASISLMVSHYEYELIFQSDNNRSIYLAWGSSADADNINYYNNLLGRGSLVSITILLYAIVFVVAIKRQINRGMQTAVEKTALNMALIGFLHCIGIVIYLSSIIILVMGLIGCDWEGHSPYCVDVAVFYLILNLGVSLCVVVTPYALLLFSTVVRRRFLQLLESIFRCSSTQIERSVSNTAQGSAAVRQPSLRLSKTFHNSSNHRTSLR